MKSSGQTVTQIDAKCGNMSLGGTRVDPRLIGAVHNLD